MAGEQLSKAANGCAGCGCLLVILALVLSALLAI